MTQNVRSQQPDPAVEPGIGTRTNWLIPNRACTEAMLRSSGFRTEHPPEPEVYFCRAVPFAPPADGPHSVYPVRNPHVQP